MFPLQFHGVPRHLLVGGHGPQRHERPPLGHRVALRALHAQDLPLLRNVAPVVTTEAPRPVPVADVGRVRLPVHLHVGEDAAVVDLRRRLRRLLHVGLSRLVDGGILLEIEAGDLRRQPLVGLRAGGVFAHEGIHNHLLHPREGAGDEAGRHGAVHRGLRREVVVRGPVVAVHAIHLFLRDGGELFLAPLVIEAEVFLQKFPAGGADLDPRDHLLLAVDGDVVDLVLDDHVPVDPRGPAERGAPAPRFHPDADLLGGVLLVVPEMGYLHQLGPEELGRPMALLARFPRGAQIFDGGRDGTRVRLRYHGEDLADSRDLRLDVPGGAVPDVAGDAAHPRVGRRQVRGVLRFHHGVAQGATEGDGLAVQEGVIRDERHEDGEERSSEGDVDEPLPVPRDVQVDERIRECFFTSHPASAQALAPHPVEEDDRAHAEERREHHVGEDADVGTGPFGAELEREREDDEEDASSGDDRPDETDRVAVQSAAARQFFPCHERPPKGKGFPGKEYRDAGALNRKTLPRGFTRCRRMMDRTLSRSRAPAGFFVRILRLDFPRWRGLRCFSCSVPKWWNWQTRHLEGVVGRPVRVQIPPSAPSQYLKGFRLSAGVPFFMKTAHVAQMWLAGKKPSYHFDDSTCHGHLESDHPIPIHDRQSMLALNITSPNSS